MLRMSVRGVARGLLQGLAPMGGTHEGRQTMCVESGPQAGAPQAPDHLLPLHSWPGALLPGCPPTPLLLSAGALHPLRPCPLAQVDSLSVTPGPLGVPDLMVSQPGCAYAVLLCSWSKDTGPPAASEGAVDGGR